MSDEDNEYADDFEDPVTLASPKTKTADINLSEQTETFNSRLRSGLIRHAGTNPIGEKITTGVVTERIYSKTIGLQAPDDLEATREETTVLSSTSTTPVAAGAAASAFQIAAPRLAAFLKTISPLVSNLLDEISAEVIMAKKEKSLSLRSSSDVTSRLKPVLSTVGLMKDVPLLLQRKIVCIAQSPSDHRDFALAFGPMPEPAVALLLRKHGVSVFRNIREGSIVTIFSNGKLSSVLSCSSQRVTCLSFADDEGLIVLAGCSDGLVHMWDRSEPSGRHPFSCGSGVILHDPKDGSPAVQRFVSLPVDGGLRSPSYSAGGIAVHHSSNDEFLQSTSSLNETCSILNVFPIKRNNSSSLKFVIVKEMENKNTADTATSNMRTRLRNGAGLRTLLFESEEATDTSYLSKGRTDNVLSKNTSTSYQIGTIDSRGRLDIWVILRSTDSLKMKRVDSILSNDELAHWDLSSGPLCCDAASSPSDVSEYMIALTSGRLLRVLRTESLNGRPPLLPRVFESPSPRGVSATKVVYNPVPLTVSSNSFSPPANVIAVGFSDGKVCIYSSRHTSPIATLNEVNGSKIVLLQWLRHRPTVLITLDECGICSVFDFCVSITGPVFLADMSPLAGLKVQSASCTGCGPYEPVTHVSIVAVFTDRLIDGDETVFDRYNGGEDRKETNVPSSEHMTVLKLDEEFCSPQRGGEEEIFRSKFNLLR
jgi:WD40 repeat protein